MMPTAAAEVTNFLQNNPDFAEEYFLQNANPKLIEKWVLNRSQHLSIPAVSKVNNLSISSKSHSNLTPSSLIIKPLPSSCRLNKYLTVNANEDDNNEGMVALADTSKRKMTAENLAGLNETDLLMELIRDIAYELDVDALSHKILVNVCHLINADRSSLFLCKGHKDRKYLISRLFDVTATSSVEEAVKPPEKAIIIPFGVGIAGYAAETGETINIKNAYKDPRFNPSVDKDTGYLTHSILCMPIKNQDGEVIGVAQIINKKDGDHIFSVKDEQVFQDYLTFCGIGLTNAELFHASVQEYERNQVLLNLARNIFEETECLETVVRRIMTQALDLLQCERCTVYILEKNLPDDEDEGIHFSQVFDLIHNQKNKNEESSDYYKDLAEKSTDKKAAYAGFAVLAVKNEEVLNIDSFTKDENFKSYETLEDSENEQFKAKCMLCCPMVNNKQEVIGVAQLFNKKDSHSFDETDEIMFEGFSIFCGLGIYNTQMYEKAALMVARQKVNMEVLQYHASAGPVDTADFAKDVIPVSEQFNLHTFDFDDIHMTDNETCLMSMRMFLDYDLLRKFRIPHKRMCQFILTVKKNYRPVTYHNWRHAFNVAQTMYTLLHTGQMFSWFSDLESLVLLVACLCHDLDHRGTNNTFQQKAESPIALLYGTSTMERHHFDHSVMILKSEGSTIFESLSEEDYKLAMKMLEEAILSTDLALYFKKRTDFLNLVEAHKADWTQFENRGILRGMMMTACDVAAITKPWEVQQRVAEMVAGEFYEQGDLERNELSSSPIPMMDRQKHGDLPKMQVGFIDFVCLPLYKVFYHINPLLKPLYDGVLNNKKNWQNLSGTYVPPADITTKSPKGQRTSKAVSRDSKAKNVSFSAEPSAKSKSCIIL